MLDILSKKYDYWLIVWTAKSGEEVYEPIAFQAGVHPEEWCKAVVDRVNNTRDERSPRYTSYKIYRLKVEQ